MHPSLDVFFTSYLVLAVRLGGVGRVTSVGAVETGDAETDGGMPWATQLGNREVLVPRSEELSEMWQRGGGGEAQCPRSAFPGWWG